MTPTGVTLTGVTLTGMTLTRMTPTGMTPTGVTLTGMTLTGITLRSPLATSVSPWLYGARRVSNGARNNCAMWQVIR
jgi:hypothetical protein